MLSSCDDKSIYASFFTRLGAYLIDCVILSTFMLIVKLPIFFAKFVNPDFILFKNVLFTFSIMDIILYLIWVSYFILTTYFFSATIGKKLLKIKVVKNDGSKPSLLDIAYRESIGRYLDSITLYIGYLIIFINNDRKALHDILCDTVVVSENFN